MTTPRSAITETPWFAITAFFALGIERLFCGYLLYTDRFKKSVGREKFPGLSSISKDGSHWRSMRRLGIFIKLFQFGVCVYDLLVLDHDNVSANVFRGEMFSRRIGTAVGLFLTFIGQLLNWATFKAFGAKGVCYGNEFEYPVARISCFPHNIKINDPQYCGALLRIFGIYITVGASSFFVPGLELFWYLMSMHVLENKRGRRWEGWVAKARNRQRPPTVYWKEGAWHRGPP